MTRAQCPSTSPRGSRCVHDTGHNGSHHSVGQSWADTTEAIERGWVCPDGSEHWWTEVVLGDRTVDELCDRCGQLKSEVR